ncbi:hypothetical protein OKA05_27330 [Luteolibacter arcticus]|uniref:DUF4349 domain-containing protein n=1 Tax=Luteolibacter arcticus TaxID=1581411 RepID=A0ABT3GS14_9BACT|nr:hypothetical protein [Luteolibacter arcticus]MCW1926297.1 hypothetical protein [Luteolibacter arcticus]
MPPRPFYRWKSFWLGVMWLAFLCWSGWRSSLGTSSIWWSGSRDVLLLCDDGGFLEVSLIEELGHGAGLQIQSASPGPAAEGELFTRPVQVRRLADHHFPKLSFSVAYWFLTLLFLIPWLGFLAWRYQRMNRHAPGTAAPPARRST